MNLGILEVEIGQWDNSGIAPWVWGSLHFQSGDCGHGCAEPMKRDRLWQSLQSQGACR